MQGQAKCGGPNSVMVQLRLSSTLLRNSDLSCGASCTHCTNTPCSSTEPVLTSAADCPKFRVKSPNFIYKSSKIL